MIETHSRWKLNPTPEGASVEVLRAHCEAVMDALLELEVQDPAVHSAAVSLDAGRRLVIIDLAVNTRDIEEAEERAAEVIRSAVAIAGGHFKNKAKLVGRRAHLIPA